jgi:hypothetical protein
MLLLSAVQGRCRPDLPAVQRACGGVTDRWTFGICGFRAGRRCQVCSGSSCVCYLKLWKAGIVSKKSFSSYRHETAPREQFSASFSIYSMRPALLLPIRAKFKHLS